MLCKLCWNKNVALKYSLNIQCHKDNHINICQSCYNNIQIGICYWEFYRSMVDWDNGWYLLDSATTDDDKQYKSMIAVLVAIFFRNAYYKTLQSK